MQTEWNRFLEGIALYKQYQGLVWLCCIVLFVVLWKRKVLKGNALWITSLLLGGMVVFPLTAMALLKAYTPYYHWLDLQSLFPVCLLMGYFGVILFDYLKEQRIPRWELGKNGKIVVAAISVVTVFAVATAFHGMDKQDSADQNGVPVTTAEAFAALEENITTAEIVLAAPSKMLTYARLYNPSWELLYGRDLWESKAAGYIYSGYTTEYQYYEYLEQMEPVLEEREKFISLVEEGQADCVIVPYYWSAWLVDVEGYEVVSLTDSYAGIIKEELLIQ